MGEGKLTGARRTPKISPTLGSYNPQDLYANSRQLRSSLTVQECLLCSWAIQSHLCFAVVCSFYKAGADLENLASFHFPRHMAFCLPPKSYAPPPHPGGRECFHLEETALQHTLIIFSRNH